MADKGKEKAEIKESMEEIKVEELNASEAVEEKELEEKEKAETLEKLKPEPKSEFKKLKKEEKEKSLEKQAKKSKIPSSPLDEKNLEERKKALLEKAKKLKEKLTEEAPKTEELKEQIKSKKRSEMLVPLDEYVKAGIYLGTKVITPTMRPFVYRRRADGLAIFNTNLIDEKLKEGVEYLSKFNAKDVILICKREAGWRAVEKFGELTGIRVFTKKYPAGILTNTKLPDFFENELTIITDVWLDKNALSDTLRVNKKVLMICDTNNFSKGASQVIIGNNKSAKSLGLIFYLLARGYMKAKGMDTTKVPDLEWWTGELQEAQKVEKKAIRVKYGV